MFILSLYIYKYVKLNSNNMCIIIIMKIQVKINDTDNVNNHNHVDNNGVGHLGKGRMGSARLGSLQFSCFLTEGLFGYPREPTLILPKVPGRTLFPQSVRTHYFRSGPISVDPVGPQPRSTSCWISAPRPAQRPPSWSSGTARMRFIHSSNRMPCSSNRCVVLCLVVCRFFESRDV